MSDRSWPSYLALRSSGELFRRAARALRGLQSCSYCPRACEKDRTAGEVGTCGAGPLAEVGSWGPHHGEEDVLRGTRGSGTVFFAGCNLRCIYCQNWEVSQGSAGEPHDTQRLAGVFLSIQALGCHNLNLVTPSHFVPQILAALALAVDEGFHLPIVYNTSGYDTVETLALLKDVVDIYLPDLKYMDPQVARALSSAPDYPEVARAALLEMHRQVGDLEVGPDGLARRGLLVRHLVLPEGLADTKKAMHFLATRISPSTYVNLMDQYRPVFQAARDPRMGRSPTPEEIHRALSAAIDEGLLRLDPRSLRGRSV